MLLPMRIPFSTDEVELVVQVGFARRFGYAVTHHRSDEITIYRMFTAEADILLALPIN